MLIVVVIVTHSSNNNATANTNAQIVPAAPPLLEHQLELEALEAPRLHLYTHILYHKIVYYIALHYITLIFLLIHNVSNNHTTQ